MVFETIRRARNRILVNEALRHGAYAASAALAALILLLLLGTQILHWAWLVGLPAAALGAGAYAIWRRWPSSYQIAQRVDRGLESPDTLSTALFFATADRHSSPDVRRAQWSQAERMANDADVRRAIPIQMPRAIYATALLGLIAGSLFGLRYGIDRRLDLRTPLTQVVQDRLAIGEQPRAVRAQDAKPRLEHRDEAGSSPDPLQPTAPSELDAATDAALDTVNDPDPDSGANSSARTSESERDGEQAGSGQSGSEGAPGAAQSGQSSENPGMLGKLRDAMSSLLSRMGTKQEAGAQSGGEAKNDPSAAGQSGKQGTQRGEGKQGGAHEGQASNDSMDAPGEQSASAGQSARDGSTKQAGSGIGREDGNKDVKLAEQLAAMGKISEIIGKRSANVSGEVTVEVTNSTQQVHTPYAARTANHAAAGGEISRDEIPLALQSYVRQYFEELRKTSAPTPAPAHPHPDPSPDRKDSK